MTDSILIDNLRLACRVGITDEERDEPQEVIVGVTIFLPLDKASKSDDLRHTVDYRDAVQRIKGFVTGGSFNLLESVAEGVASLVLSSPGVERVAVRVRKTKYSVEPLIVIELERGGGQWSSRS